MTDRAEVRRIERRIAKAERRIARGTDLRREVLRGEVTESGIAAALKERLRLLTA